MSLSWRATLNTKQNYNATHLFFNIKKHLQTISKRYSFFMYIQYLSVTLSRPHQLTQRPLLYIFTIIVISTCAFARTSNESFNLKTFQLGRSRALQSSDSSIVGVTRHIPNYALNDTLSFGLGIDTAFLKFDSNITFAAIGHSVCSRAKVTDQINAQLNTGVQPRMSGCDTKTALGLTVMHDLVFQDFNYLKNIYLAYLPLFHNSIVHISELGVGIEF